MITFNFVSVFERLMINPALKRHELTKRFEAALEALKTNPDTVGDVLAIANDVEYQAVLSVVQKHSLMSDERLQQAANLRADAFALAVRRAEIMSAVLFRRLVEGHAVSSDPVFLPNLALMSNEQLERYISAYAMIDPGKVPDALHAHVDNAYDVLQQRAAYVSCATSTCWYTARFVVRGEHGHKHYCTECASPMRANLLLTVTEMTVDKR